MPSSDKRLELKAKDINGSDRLTAGCVLIDLASMAVSRTAVYANGITMYFYITSTAPTFDTFASSSGRLIKIKKKLQNL
jgi:hypothetical protein